MAILIRILDIILTILLSPVFLVFLLWRHLRWYPVSSDEKSLLQFDMAYTHSMICTRKLQAAYTAAQLDSYFTKVWSVHPFSSVADGPESQSCGPVQEFCLTNEVSVVEAKVGRYQKLAQLPFFNFTLSQIELLRYLDRQISKYGLCIIKCGDPYYLGLVSLALGWTYRIPVVIRIGANYDRIYQDTGRAAMPKLFRYRKFEVVIQRFVLARMSHVLAPVQDYIDFAVHNGARPERCTLLPYGNLIDPLHFIEPQSRSRGDRLNDEFPDILSAPIIVCVGRLEAVKMPDHAIRAISELKKKGLKCNLLLIGDGALRESLHDLVDELGIKGQVFFAGNRDQEWLADILPVTDIVASPLTGRALTECALAALPLVGYDIDWQPEIIMSDKTGILVPARNVQKMAEALEQLIRDPRKAKLLGHNARQWALETMDPNQIKSREMELFDRLRDGSRTTIGT